jgi:hypothetical protein
MPFFANFEGSGSGGSVAATSTRPLTAADLRPKWERSVLMSYLARTLLRVSACGAAAAAAENFAALKATGLS